MLTYSELIKIPTFEERLIYLQLDAVPSEVTFDKLRAMNQNFYRSKAWKDIRRQVIARDFGCDLGVPGYDILGKVLVHHMNPITPKDLYLQHSIVIDPNNLITVSNDTHLRIHYRMSRPDDGFPDPWADRVAGDTNLW